MSRWNQAVITQMAIFLSLLLILSLLMTFVGSLLLRQSLPTSSSGQVSHAFTAAAHEFSVPAPLLLAICYMEGRFSNHGGSPSADNGFGCMHLVKNGHVNTLDRAAAALKVSEQQIKLDLTTNIRGGAFLLHSYALQLSPNHTLPTSIDNWYGAIAAYSNADLRATALLYADTVYQLLRDGVVGQADDGETVTLAPESIQPVVTTASAVTDNAQARLPGGCKKDRKVDYPAAIDCLVRPATFDCNRVKQNQPCTYESARRPADYPVTLIVIHDIEGTLRSALNVFQNPASYASTHYIVDSNGTVYQVVPEQSVAYHAGNYWYNQHSIGIEHAGFDATGYRWYNATEYLASARLVAYLLRRYNIPLDHAHILSHGTVPSPSATSLPNHVDPGPYWLWDYYLGLIHAQGVPFPGGEPLPGSITLRPESSQRLPSTHAGESKADSGFLYLYQSPNTHAARIPQQGQRSDITDVTSSVEADLSYYPVAQSKDRGGSGDTMYKIWYGVETGSAERFAHARQVWLAVPPGAAEPGQGTLIRLAKVKSGHLPIYGRPPDDTGRSRSNKTPPAIADTAKKQDASDILGDAPSGALFVSAYTWIVTKGDTEVLWYEINYNHRQAWVPASEVSSSLT